MIDVSAAGARRIVPSDIAGKRITAPRLLLRTNTFPDHRNWRKDFASLSPELIEDLHDRGVILVGIDTPSIDPYLDARLESHRAAARLGLVNLEGLVLRHVDPGFYTLVALPLRLAGAEASPVRAVLVAATPEFPG